MLCRPQDASFFGRALRAFVLDEVHLYSGTLAAEICLLMRRVALRCDVSPDKVLHIATSATLGGNATDLRHFGAALFSKRPDLICPIYGRAHRRDMPVADGPETPPAPERIDARPLETLPLVDAGRRELVSNPATAAIAQQCIAPLVSGAVVRSLANEPDRRGFCTMGCHGRRSSTVWMSFSGSGRAMGKRWSGCVRSRSISSRKPARLRRRRAPRLYCALRRALAPKQTSCRWSLTACTFKCVRRATFPSV